MHISFNSKLSSSIQRVLFVLLQFDPTMKKKKKSKKKVPIDLDALDESTKTPVNEVQTEQESEPNKDSHDVDNKTIDDGIVLLLEIDIIAKRS